MMPLINYQAEHDMSHHLSELSIQSFRGLRQLHLQDLGRFNLFVGANNSGKTSILEAIGLFARPLDLQEWLNTAKRREITKSKISWIELIEHLFPHNQKNGAVSFKPDIRINGRGAFGGRELLGILQQDEYLDLDAPEVDVYAHERIRVEITAHFSVMGTDELIEGWSVLELEEGSSQIPFSRRVREPYLPLAHITPYSHRTERMQIETLSAAIENERLTELIQILQTLDPNIQDLVVLAPDGQTPRIYLRHLKAGLLPLSVMGDGMRRTLAIAAVLSEVRNGVLLIDEIESAIHISALEKVFPWLLKQCQALNIQVFASTHSLEALDALMMGDPDGSQLVVYHLGNESAPSRLQGDVLRRLRLERGLDVR